MAGERVRQVPWEDRWLVYSEGLWYIVEADENLHIVRGPEFSHTQFKGTNWTTDPYTAPDICSLPGPSTTFDPPALAVLIENGGVPKFKIVLSGVFISYFGPNPITATATGSLELTGTHGQSTWNFAGTIGAFYVTASYDSSTDELTAVALDTGTIGGNSDAGALPFPKVGSTIVFPQFSGTFYFEEAGTYDLVTGGPGDNGTNTHRTDGGTVAVERVGISGLLQITAQIGPGSPGTYRLMYFADGVLLAQRDAQPNSATSITVDADTDKISVRIESALPLAPWTETAFPR